jgi:hypothetical protein
MSLSYSLQLSERYDRLEILKILLKLPGFLRPNAEPFPYRDLLQCTATGLLVNVMREQAKSEASREFCYRTFGIRPERAVSFDPSKEVDLYDQGQINMLNAVQALLLELPCDAAWLVEYDDCMLRRIDGDITLYNGSGVWSPGVEPDLLSRVIFPYQLEERFPLSQS